MITTAGFNEVTFSGTAHFVGATFSDTARFDGATFVAPLVFGEVTGARYVSGLPKPAASPKTP